MIDYNKRRKRAKSVLKDKLVKEGELTKENQAGDVLVDDYNVNLEGIEGWDTYNRMVKSDTKIRAIYNIMTHPILQNKHFVDNNDCPENQRRFFHEIFFSKINWKRTLSDILKFLQFGQRFCYYKLMLDENGMNTIDKIKCIPYPAIRSFDFNGKTGDFEGLVIESWQGDKYIEDYFEAKELLCFYYNESAENPFGESMLRSLYRSWKMKDALLKIDVIRHDRSGAGYPFIKKKSGTGSSKSSDEIDREARNIGTNMRISEKGYVSYWEEEMDVGLLTPQGTGSDPIASVNYHDREMNSAILASFMNLGQSGVGSYSVGELQVSPYTNHLNSIDDYICSVFNELIKEITIRNWGHQEKYCRMAHDDMNKIEINSLVNSFIPLMDYGILTPEYVASLLKVPEDDLDKIRIRVEDKQNIKATKEIEEQNKNKKIIEVNKSEEINNPEEDTKTELSETKLSGDLLKIDNDMNNNYESSISLMESIREKAIANLAGIFSSGKKPTNKTFVTLKEIMARKLKPIYEKAYKSGYNSIDNSIRLAEEEEEEEIINILLQQQILYIVSSYFNYINLLRHEIGGLDLAGMSKSQILGLITQKLDRDFSKNRIKDLAGYANKIYGVAREKKLVRSGYTEVVYDAILDKNICRVCLPFDKKRGFLDKASGKYITKAGQVLQAPNPACLGGGLCRCILRGIK